MMKGCNDEGSEGVEKSRTITTSNFLTGLSTLSVVGALDYQGKREMM